MIYLLFSNCGYRLILNLCKTLPYMWLCLISSPSAFPLYQAEKILSILLVFSKRIIFYLSFFFFFAFLLNFRFYLFSYGLNFFFSKFIKQSLCTFEFFLLNNEDISLPSPASCISRYSVRYLGSYFALSTQVLLPGHSTWQMFAPWT